MIIGRHLGLVKILEEHKIAMMCMQQLAVSFGYTLYNILKGIMSSLYIQLGILKRC